MTEHLPLTLKMLTDAATGGIIAAPTTSLPEQLGGARNWDYRYCWLRDATLTLMALMSAGYRDEAYAWGDWLLRSASGSPEQIQIMYGVAGERQFNEWEVPWLPGSPRQCASATQPPTSFSSTLTESSLTPSARGGTTSSLLRRPGGRCKNG